MLPMIMESLGDLASGELESAATSAFSIAPPTRSTSSSVIDGKIGRLNVSRQRRSAPGKSRSSAPAPHASRQWESRWSGR